jgi:hypothetical protein
MESDRRMRTIEKICIKKVKGEKTKYHSILSTIAIMMALSLLIYIALVTPAHALTRYYNCVARVANKNATLSMENVDACYNMIFKGAANYYSGNTDKHNIIRHSVSQDSPVTDLQKNLHHDNSNKKYQSIGTGDVFK